MIAAWRLREQVEACCKPLTPEQALEDLQELYDYTSASPRVEEGHDLLALNAAIEVLRRVLSLSKLP
jgi:hypothetical protein